MVNVPWQGRMVEVSLDEVEGVGQYVELELTADAEESTPGGAAWGNWPSGSG